MPDAPPPAPPAPQQPPPAPPPPAPPQHPDDPDDEPRDLPGLRARVSVLSHQRTEARREAQQLRQRVAELEASVSGHSAAVETAVQAAIARRESEYRQDLELSDMGVRDPLGRRAVLDAWAATDPDPQKRKPLRDVWEGWTKGDRSQVPRTVLGYLPEPAAPETQGGGGGSGFSFRPPPAPPRTETGVRGSSGAPTVRDVQAWDKDKLDQYLAEQRAARRRR